MSEPLSGKGPDQDAAPEFTEFPKIARLSRDCVITEKIDGTNASILVTEDGRLFAGSRTRWITPEQDNYGFARWAYDHAEELKQLGPGHHFGEWWGSGCQRGYDLPRGEKRFSLFNVSRWHMAGVAPFETRPADPRLPSKFSTEAPACCLTVPILYRGPFSTLDVEIALDRLRTEGSLAAPGFMRPEGIVVWHEAARILFKKTLEKDEPKGMRR